MSEQGKPKAFRDAVVARVRDDEMRIAADTAKMTPGNQGIKFDGRKVANVIHVLDKIVVKYEPLIISLTPDQYNSYVNMVADLVHSVNHVTP